MIKDNHVAVAGSVEEAVRRAVEAGIERIIVEVDRVAQVEPALKAGATHLLLDNMGFDELRACVALVGGKVPTEASGDFSTAVGGGAKISLAGPLRVRFDYRLFNLRGRPRHDQVHRVYAGLNLMF